jgi:peptidoglycan/xylan/chitin deacetylase (PgdA/CDA1 family)
MKDTRLKLWVPQLRFSRTLFELSLVALVLLLANRPASAPLFWQARFVNHVDTRQKVVALTFDDGPHPVYTPRILRLLEEYRAHATFFMVGKRMEAYPDVVRSVVAAGHVIGNHTYDHPLDIVRDNQPQVIGEIDRCEQVIERLTGRRAEFFRPPCGTMDEAIYVVAAEEGYRTVLWSICADHHDAPTPQLMAQRVLKQVRPGGIVLIHDGMVPDRWKDVVATRLILEGLSKRGYRFVTLPELLKGGKPAPTGPAEARASKAGAAEKLP